MIASSESPLALLGRRITFVEAAAQSRFGPAANHFLFVDQVAEKKNAPVRIGFDAWHRIRSVIVRQVAILARRKLGLNAQAKLNAHGRQHLNEFAAVMHAVPEVLECQVLMGPVDFLLRIVTAAATILVLNLKTAGLCSADALNAAAASR